MGALFCYLGCKKEDSKDSASDLEKAGRVVYVTRCTACHNEDPKLSGSIGPEVYGSSLELIRTRVWEASYPPGYKPKRSTKLMVPMKDLKDSDIEALHAYLSPTQL